MRIEKLFAYIFLTFILMVACFNIIGSLSMLIIDKKNDVITLRNLGATDSQIRRIFLFEGRMISAAGAVIGIALGLLLAGYSRHTVLYSSVIKLETSLLMPILLAFIQKISSQSSSQLSLLAGFPCGILYVI